MAASEISIEERQHTDNKQPIVLPGPGREIIAELTPVTITTPEGEVFEIADAPLNLGRAAALASEQTLRGFGTTRRRITPAFTNVCRYTIRLRWLDDGFCPRNEFLGYGPSAKCASHTPVCRKTTCKRIVSAGHWADVLPLRGGRPARNPRVYSKGKEQQPCWRRTNE